MKAEISIGRVGLLIFGSGSSCVSVIGAISNCLYILIGVLVLLSIVQQYIEIRLMIIQQ